MIKYKKKIYYVGSLDIWFLAKDIVEARKKLARFRDRALKFRDVVTVCDVELEKVKENM